MRVCVCVCVCVCVSIYSFKSYLFKIVEKRSFPLHNKSYHYKSNFLLIFLCSWFHNQSSDKNSSKIFVVELKKKNLRSLQFFNFDNFDNFQLFRYSKIKILNLKQ